MAGDCRLPRRVPLTCRIVTLRNFGYGTGENWGKTKAYFEKAWPNVMDALVKRFAAKG